MKNYLVLFYHFDRHGYVDFRLEEFESLCSLYGHNNPFPNGINKPTKQQNLHDPFIIAQLPNEEIAHKICSRSMLTKSIYDVLICGNTINEIILKLKKNYNVSQQLSSYLDKTHRIRNIYFGKKCSHEENLHNILLLTEPFLSFMTGKISLHSAQIEYHLVADYGDWTHCGESQPRDTPKKVYLCRYITGSSRDIIRKFSLKKRKYVGSTSLDSELSFLMANQCRISTSNLVFDPFCGTGSLLIAATYFGGIVFGGDIDIRVLRGNKYFQHGMKKSDKPKQKHKNQYIEEKEIIKNTLEHSIYANFKQYKLCPPELIRCDLNNISMRCSPALKFDAILCDPPYGLRAPARKCGHKNPIKIPKKYEENHHPRTQIYDQKDIMYDLLQFVAKYLKLNGRFVYLLPATIDFDESKDLPTHPCLNIIGNSEQKCQGIFRRILITMEKYKEFEGNMVPFIPNKPDFDDMKNKIFFKQHSHHQKKNNNNDTENNKKKKKKKRKRKNSPILTQVVNPNDMKKQKLSLKHQNDIDIQ